MISMTRLFGKDTKLGKLTEKLKFWGDKKAEETLSYHEQKMVDRAVAQRKLKGKESDPELMLKTIKEKNAYRKAMGLKPRRF